MFVVRILAILRLLFLPFLLFCCRRAAASEPTTPIRIDYSVPKGCPSRTQLIRHVLERTTRARVANATEEARELVVRVERVGARFRGRLIVAAGSAHQERDVTDPDCEEVIEALGFFIALSIDPSAGGGSKQVPEAPPFADVAPPPAPADAPAAAPGAPAPTATAPPATARPAAAQQVTAPPATAPLATAPPATFVPPSAAPPVSPENTSERPRPEQSPSRRLWQFGGGVGAAIVSGTSPDALFASRAHVELVKNPGEDEIFAPSFAIAGTSTSTSTLRPPGGALALRWQAFTAMFCPLAFRLGREAAIRPCTGLEIGSLRADGTAIPNARRNDAPWFGFGLSAQVDVAVWSKLALLGELGAATPISRSRFSYSSGEIVFETPAVGGRVGLTLVLRP